MDEQLLRIGGASGFWGDAAGATTQLLDAGNLDFIVYDYLAEITMSIMARARAKDPSQGYAADFVTSAMAPHLRVIADRGVRIISNAGGVNPEACASALRAEIKKQQLGLTVACITGDDLTADRESVLSGVREMFTGALPPEPAQIQSINAYLGAFPIAAALDRGADIVVTGRCVDSAVTLAACIHHHGWRLDQYDLLASGSLAGHILECGPQATGGNFTDWEQVADSIDRIGYPIAEIGPDGAIVITKPVNSGGMVSVATVAEQMLYEIGDPQAYILPDVVCDFSDVVVEQAGADRVALHGARGAPAPDTLKVCATYADEFRGGTLLTFYGEDADRRARAFCEAALRAARRLLRALELPDYSETSIEIIGDGSHYGDHAAPQPVREVVAKIAAKHPAAIGIGILMKELVGLGLATPPGLCGFQGTRPKPSPVVRLYSFPLPRKRAGIHIETENGVFEFTDVAGVPFDPAALTRPHPPAPPVDVTTAVPLVKLAWARSGDKGNAANIGVIAREPEYLPYIWAALDESVVRDRFAHLLDEEADDAVSRYLLPGSNAINFLLRAVLGGGGVASIRNDPQGKTFSQLLLACPIAVSSAIAEAVS